jgi:hypothetical protein
VSLFMYGYMKSMVITPSGGVRAWSHIFVARVHTTVFFEEPNTSVSGHHGQTGADLAPFPSLGYSLTHAHRSIGYHNHNPQTLSESVTRLMYLRVYDSRDSSCQPATSPSLCYPLTHAHRSIGYRNRNPHSLTESAARLMHLRVYDNRDSSHQSAPSPSLYYSFTHAHSTLPTSMLLTITCIQVLWFLERLTRTTASCCVTTRTRLTVCLPTQTSVCETF